MVLIENEIKKSGYSKNLPAGLVFTGGASKTLGLKELSKEVLPMPVRIASPEGVSGLIDEIQSPAYATAVGLILFGVKSDGNKAIMAPIGIGLSQVKGIFGKVGNWIKSFLP